MKIHFACLFGVDYDLDLLPWWGPYYLDRNFDTYKVFLHRETGDVDGQTITLFRKMGFGVETARGFHGRGLLRKFLMLDYVKSLPKDDILVTADADEFQQGPDGKPLDYARLFQEYDYINGFMYDRYNDALLPCYEDPFAQYLYEEPYTGNILNNFTPPRFQKSKWPHTRRTKILAARAGADISYDGSHCARSIEKDARVLDGCRVVHFAWREASRRKIAIKDYYHKENLEEIFEGDAPEELLSCHAMLQGKGLR